MTLIGALLLCIDWTSVGLDVINATNSNIKFNGIDLILKNIKVGNIKKTIRGAKVTFSGVRDTVKKLSGLSTGPKTMLMGSLKKTIGFQFKASFKGVGLFSAIIDFGQDFAESILKLSLEIINGVKFIADVLASIVYKVLRSASSALIKTILMPFIGPFAWLVSMLLDIGIDLINLFIDLKREVSNLIEWVMKQGCSLITNFVEAVRKIW